MMGVMRVMRVIRGMRVLRVGRVYLVQVPAQQHEQQRVEAEQHREEVELEHIGDGAEPGHRGLHLRAAACVYA